MREDMRLPRRDRRIQTVVHECLHFQAEGILGGEIAHERLARRAPRVAASGMSARKMTSTVSIQLGSVSGRGGSIDTFQPFTGVTVAESVCPVAPSAPGTPPAGNRPPGSRRCDRWRRPGCSAGRRIPVECPDPPSPGYSDHRTAPAVRIERGDAAPCIPWQAELLGCQDHGRADGPPERVQADDSDGLRGVVRRTRGIVHIERPPAGDGLARALEVDRGHLGE